jgi:subtilisin family serine protease
MHVAGYLSHLVLMIAMGQSDPNQSTCYYHFHDRIALQLDRSHLAIHHPQSSAAQLEAGLQARIPLAGIAARAIANWSLAELRDAASDADAVALLVRQAASEDSNAFVSPVFIDSVGGSMNVTPHILLGFNGEVPTERAEQIIAEMVRGQVAEREFGAMKGAYRLKCDSKDGFKVLATANALALRPEVKYAEPDMIFTGKSSLIPNDPAFNQCWGLHNLGQSGGVADMDMDAPEAWDFTTGSSDTLVVIIDDGIQPDHPDLNLFTPGIDTTTDGGDGKPISDCDNHGTSVAGCVSGRINNALGMVGIAPGCRCASARTLQRFPICDPYTFESQASWTVNSLAWAQSIGARITNNSNAYGFVSSAIDVKYSDTHDAGMVHFASTGNFALSSITYPASIPVVNAVGALDRTGIRPSFSDYGTGMDFSAPGVDIYTTDRTGAAGIVPGDYFIISGTTFASPYAAGVAALILSGDPSLTAVQVETIMQHSCVDRGAPGYDTEYGWGFVNAYNALTVVYHADLTPPSPNPMSFSTSPAAASPTSITMEAALATDAASPSVQYLFDFVSGSSGGTDSAWQTSRTYTDNNLTPNSPYTYRVKARDIPTPNAPNETQYSPNALGSSAIETPTGLVFGAPTGGVISVSASGSFTNMGFGSTGFYFEMTPAAGSGANTWLPTPATTVTDLRPGATYTFRAKARNFQSAETPFTSATSVKAGYFLNPGPPIVAAAEEK